LIHVWPALASAANAVEALVSPSSVIVLLASFALLAGCARVDNCAMWASFNDPHPVLQEGARSLFWIAPMQVDADGAPNAYHRDDPHGSKGLAIEHIGYGMSITKNGKWVPFRPKEEQNAAWLEAYQRIVENGWKAPRGYSVSIYGFAKNAKGEICVTADGRLVSTTSLLLKRDDGPCDQSRYVDALQFPGVVVPNRAPNEETGLDVDLAVAPPFAVRGVRRGDLLIAYHPGTKRWRGAFIHDTGPRRKLGEGSVRLIMNLTGTTEPPATALATNSMAIPEIYYLLFPGTVGDLGDDWNWTPKKIEDAALSRFKAWGGGTTFGALARLLACARRYKVQEPRTS
jgi:hypothetical protein